MPYKFRKHFLLVCLLTLLATACQPGLTDQEPYPLPPATQALATLLARGVATGESREYPAPIGGPMAPTPTGAILQPTDVYPAPQAQPTPGEPAALLASRHFLAGRLGLEVRQVRLVSWEEAAWITPNLGCEGESDLTLQTPTPGYRIILYVNGRDFELHSDQAGEFICMVRDTSPTHSVPTSMPSPLASLPTVLPDQQMANIHRAIIDLARILNATPTEVNFVKTFSDEFPASNLGCPVGKVQPQPIPALVTGQVIILEYQEEKYIYHARSDQVIFCGQE